MADTALTPLVGACISLGSALVSLTGLVMTFRNAGSARRNSDIALTLDMWARYEKYSKELCDPKATPDEALASFLNVLNFIENICLIHNRNLPTTIISSAISSIASTFLAGAEKFPGFSDIKNQLATSPYSFSEIREYCSRNARDLTRRGLYLDDTIFSPPPKQ